MSDEKLLMRLSRIEGQVRGVSKMIQEDRSHQEIITQLSAINSAVNSVAREVLNEHLRHCVVDAIKSGREESTIDDLIVALDSYFKMKK